MDEIVIAGISGRLPESDNLEEFWENLINGVDMVTEDNRRWTPGKTSHQIKDKYRFLILISLFKFQLKKCYDLLA